MKHHFVLYRCLHFNRSLKSEEQTTMFTQNLCAVCKTPELETKGPRSSGQQGEVTEPNSLPPPSNIAHLQASVSRDLLDPTPPH